MTCEHKRLKHGYEKTYDVQWCLDCGVITHSSDGLIGPGLHKRTDWSNWINVNLEAWSCRNEAHDGKRCSHWCGGATCPASIRSVATTTQNDSISVSEVSPQKPDWDEACEAMRWLNDIEAMQGGKNGPSIKLRSAIEALQAERDQLRALIAERDARDEQDATARLTLIRERDAAVADAREACAKVLRKVLLAIGATVASERMVSGDEGTRCSWIELGDKGLCDIDNEFAELLVKRCPSIRAKESGNG